MFELQVVSVKDDLWRRISYKITGCKSKADDLVNDMYLRLHKNYKKKEISDAYVIMTLKSIFLNNQKTKTRTLCVDNYINIHKTSSTYEINDEELNVLEKTKDLSPIQVELLSMTYDYSLREIQEETKVSYGHIFREVKKSRQKILGKNLKGYNNKRRKNHGSNNKTY